MFSLSARFDTSSEQPLSQSLLHCHKATYKYHGKFLATDPRDKIFTIFGLAIDYWIFSPFYRRLNYWLNMEEVFLRLPKVMVTPQEWPIMLHFDGRGHNPITDSEVYRRLPLWVPEWSHWKGGLKPPGSSLGGSMQTPRLVRTHCALSRATSA